MKNLCGNKVHTPFLSGFSIYTMCIRPSILSCAEECMYAHGVYTSLF